ncbi:MAG: arylesterase [Gammaproteobacteria bacterium]|nr:arylesterase [Gammaproteobacteria bacterium]
MINTTLLRQGRWLPAIVFMTAVIACSDPEATLSTLDTDAVILAFGDSLTYGTGAGRENGYPARLATMTKREVINAGNPGELSAAGRERLPGLLARHRPDLVILCHGGNDILRQRSADTAAANLTAMIRMIRDSGSEVLLIAVPEPGLFPSAASFYSDVARETGTPIIVDALADILSSPALKADAVHPNKSGYAELAQAIMTKLQDTGAL